MADKIQGNTVNRRGLTARGSVMLYLINVLLLTTFLLIASGCDSFLGNIQGDVNTNKPPIVEFANVPAEKDTFSYAPVVYWKGRDSDGFVEHYLYADIIDSSALIDPEYYIDFIPEEAWVLTETTSDTVYLLTETGEITEHVFYLKCVDDLETESQVIYRIFYRSNDPPRVPEIKWWEFPDSTFANNISVENNTVPDTLYCLDEITDDWYGLGFIWKSSDPDDRDLYTIPLEYRYYLEKVPHDTVWEWTARVWSNTQDLQFSGLETGHYIFTVWARDDGFEKSIRPATATFDVYRPSFEQDLLLLNVTSEDAETPEGRGNIVPGTQVGELYIDLCLRSGYTPDYIHLPDENGTQPWKSLLGRYRLIIYFSENYTGSGLNFDSALIDYIKIGGRLWVIGSFMNANSVVGDKILDLAKADFADPSAQPIMRQPDFRGAASGVEDLPGLDIDTTKISEVCSEYLRRWDFVYLPGIDIMATGDDAEAVYYFMSYTDELKGDVTGDIAEVKVYAADSIYYPPTPVDCIIKMPKNRILEVSRVENVSRGVIGEVQSWTNNAWRSGSEILAIAKISYPFGDPWSVEDTILVDYRYQPTSETHRRPCAVRFEKLSRLSSGDNRDIFYLRYRVAVFTFPLYFLDNSQDNVTRMFNNMLNWFYQPTAH